MNSINQIFNDISDNLLYSPLIGIYPCKVNLYTPFINGIAKIFFKILDDSKIEYYVFAGSSIGLVRNNKSIPWVDDYDIIVFEKDFTNFEKLLKVFEYNLFKIKPVYRSASNKKNSNKLCGYSLSSPRYKLNNTKTSFFHIDVFFSKVENNLLKNTCNWGLYDKSNVPISYVVPQNYQKFDDMYLPFFNDYTKDIELEYGDVLNRCVVHVQHGTQAINLNKHWTECYNEFEDFKNISIENTKNKIFDLSQNNNNNIFDSITDHGFDNDNYLMFMKFIANNINSCKEKIINIFNIINVKYVLDIKFYFPKVVVNIHINSVEYLEEIRFFLEFIDNIIVYDNYLYQNVENYLNSIVVINKPSLIYTIDINKNLIKGSKIPHEDYTFVTGIPKLDILRCNKLIGNIVKKRL